MIFTDKKSTVKNTSCILNNYITLNFIHNHMLLSPFEKKDCNKCSFYEVIILLKLLQKQLNRRNIYFQKCLSIILMYLKTL